VDDLIASNVWVGEGSRGDVGDPLGNGLFTKPVPYSSTSSYLMNHLGEQVPESAWRLCSAEQVPFFKFEAEDFPVAVLRGGKGLPKGGSAEVEPEA
jgi:hypothetical protein